VKDADPFAEVFALVTPQKFLNHPGATGAGVRVAIIDSGIDRGILERRAVERNQPVPTMSGGIFVPGQTEPTPWLGQASTPHGTTVADIVLTLAPRVELFSADIIGPAGVSDVDLLLKAIRWSIDVWQCHILNLSLGITEQRLQPIQRRHQLQRVVEEAYFKDVLIFAAAHNDHPLTHSYPAAFAPPLISVGRGTFEEALHFAYQLRERIEFQAYSRGYVGPFAADPATSWATPHLTGIAARLLSLRPGLKPFEMKTLLYWLGQT